ncbi:DUF4325 domain-containing protein [Hymenobacter aquaticus]|uniref:DUF4325 domain-containing protein n=1 Tax=Hymenobacter aquaticus TaxID=1867101 RepID=A0A4Z0PY15_9BACT|nr:STAS-like domain-containing protein [Hymenobacter aquaticus]TGE22136.1 DUF4325 domain-containing protein [Hymenobacter aquaticus]
MEPAVVYVAHIVAGTSTNADGYSLKTVLEKYFRAGQIVRLSLKGATPMSSSFLNSSFGELIENFGVDRVRELVKLVDFKPSQALAIKDYIDKFSRHFA